MMTYYYETHASNRPFKVQANNDGEALQQIRQKYGENLQGVIIVYVEESADNMRTVWLE